MELPEHSVSIIVENRELKQYNTGVSNDGKLVSCWIASEVGQVC